MLWPLFPKIFSFQNFVQISAVIFVFRLSGAMESESYCGSTKVKNDFKRKKKEVQLQENSLPATGQEGVKGKVLCCCHQPEKVFIWKLRSHLSSDFEASLQAEKDKWNLHFKKTSFSGFQVRWSDNLYCGWRENWASVQKVAQLSVESTILIAEVEGFSSKVHSSLSRKLRFQVLKWQSSLRKDGNLGFSSKGCPTLSRKLRFQVLQWVK